MKFLADMGVSMTTVRTLRDAGHDVVHLRELDLITLPDERIMEKGAQEKRIILTFDLDFGELLAAARHTVPSVILFRLRNQTPQAVGPRLFEVLGAAAEALQHGAIVVVRDEGFRVRRLPIARP